MPDASVVPARPIRQSAVVMWGVTAGICMSTVLFIWTAIPEKPGYPPLGQSGSAAVLLVAVAVAVVGVAAGLKSRRTSPLLRWCVALPVALVATAVGALAVIGVFTDRNGMWILLAYGALGMLLVAGSLARTR
jgi:hypothetical protein